MSQPHQSSAKLAELHKWHSNEPVLEINSQLDNELEQSYTKNN